MLQNDEMQPQKITEGHGKEATCAALGPMNAKVRSESIVLFGGIRECSLQAGDQLRLRIL